MDEKAMVVADVIMCIYHNHPENDSHAQTDCFGKPGLCHLIKSVLPSNDLHTLWPCKASPFGGRTANHKTSTKGNEIVSQSCLN
jgi:hypothetical protein